MGKELVLYSDWRRQSSLLRKLEATFRYFEIKGNVESYADSIIEPHGFRSKLLPTLTTGVQGDYGTYRFVLAIERRDAKKPVNMRSLERLSTRLTNEIDEINRVVFLIDGSIKDDALLDGYFFRQV
ncbi:MAG: hypothetical protein V1731_00670 [Candidatus Aenigmatarchaeota archaeon]